jgi:hypothetical protein
MAIYENTAQNIYLIVGGSSRKERNYKNSNHFNLLNKELTIYLPSRGLDFF